MSERKDERRPLAGTGAQEKACDLDLSLPAHAATKALLEQRVELFPIGQRIDMVNCGLYALGGGRSV